ncbi:MAG: TonB-dependent receptor [Bacteroidetes bacterium]|nr:TonB-dependent receptor [Bacteroidota bacterium]
MKLSFLLIFAALLQVSATTKAQQITLNKTNASLSETLDEVRRQSGYSLLSDADIVNQGNSVTVHVKNISLDAALRLILANQPFSYVINNKTIVIYAKSKLPGDKAQIKSVSGQVTDNNGQPLPGITVRLKDSQQATVTDKNGVYHINVPDENAILIFQSIGFATQEIPVQGRTTIDVKLVEENSRLNEVIVTGYKTERKKDISGAVSIVDVGETLKESNSNILTSLQSRVPGIEIESDGTPGGDGTSIRIRGFSSLSANGPLFVIDGVATTYSGALNPADIESIQVLKDAASASIYGSRANNGVIVITTKKGKTTKPVITFNSYYGQERLIDNNFQMLNSQQWANVLWQAEKNSGESPSNPVLGAGATPVIPQYLDAAKTLPSASTNWIDAIMRHSTNQNYDFGVGQSLDRSNYYFGMGYNNEQGIEKYTGYDRYTARFNSSFKLTNRISIGENVSVANFHEVKGNSLYDAVLQNPLIPVYANDGNFGGPVDGLGDKLNPLAELYFNKDNKSKNWRVFGNVFADVSILPGLNFHSSFGVDHNNSTLRAFTPSFTEGRFVIRDNFLTQSESDGLDWTATNTLNYKYQLGKHSFELFGGIEAIKSTSNAFSASGKDFLENNYSYAYLGNAEAQNGMTGGANGYTLYSQFGKFNYNYDNKYLFAATVRRDGSSRFGAANQYGVFPGFSAAWRAKNEDFLKDVVWLDDLKLRASWGITGNQEIGDYNTLNFYATNHEFGTYDIQGTNTSSQTAFFATQLGNAQLKWESQKQTDIGLDFTIFRSLTVSADYYNKVSTNVLINPVLLAVYGGANPPYINAGSFGNKGLELQLSYKDNNAGDFHYGVDFNIAFNSNKVLSLTNGVPYILGTYANRLTPGQPVSEFYGYVADGLFTSQAEVDNSASQPGKGLGRIKYKDLNGDGVIDSKDQTNIGNPNPKFISGLNLHASYRNFDASVFLSGAYGNKIYNSIRTLTDFAYFPFNFGKATLNAWSTSNTNSTIPELNTANLNNELRYSSYFVENGSYLKIKSIQVGYSLPKSVLSKIGVGTLRFYIQGQNLFTFTKYSGMDPQVGAGGVLSEGIDSQFYPHSRSVNIGLNVKF